MTELPPRDRLLRTLRALAAELPAQMEGLLEAPRFQGGREALARLADPEHAARAVAAMTDEEAASLAERLTARWSRIAAPEPAKEASILAPAEVWVQDTPVHVDIEVTAEGVDDGWEAVWDGPVLEGPPSRRAVLVVEPLTVAETANLHIRAHVRAKARGQRMILVAETIVVARRGAPPSH